MRILLVLYMAGGLAASPWGWADLPSQVQGLLAEAGLSGRGYAGWQQQQRSRSQERLAAGAAEHIAYFVLQTRSLGGGPPLDPAVEARRYFQSLSAADRETFLPGGVVATPMRESVQARMDAFWQIPPKTPRHQILRRMGARLGWKQERILQTAFRFLVLRSDTSDADDLYQKRGLSADPFAPSMLAVKRGLAWLRANGGPTETSVLLAGPGAELGSRFGLDDSLPVASPQPAAVLALLSKRPARFDCFDIRPEVTESLAAGPCKATTGDLVLDRLPTGRYDVAIATNLLVYLDDQMLGVALANLAQSLRPGGCLLHNDSRFAARLFGEAAGIAVKHFESVVIGRRAERDQLDRIVIHCKVMATP